MIIIDKMDIKNNEFYCEHCNYISNDKYNYSRHLNSNKHKKTTMININIEDIDDKPENENILFIEKKNKIKSYKCKCGKKYKHQPNLIRHKKTNCKYKKNDENKLNNLIDDKGIINYKELIVILTNENIQLKNMLNEIIEKYNVNN